MSDYLVVAVHGHKATLGVRLPVPISDEQRQAILGLIAEMMPMFLEPEDAERKPNDG